MATQTAREMSTLSHGDTCRSCSPAPLYPAWEILYRAGDIWLSGEPDEYLDYICTFADPQEAANAIYTMIGNLGGDPDDAATWAEYRIRPVHSRNDDAGVPIVPPRARWWDIYPDGPGLSTGEHSAWVAERDREAQAACAAGWHHMGASPCRDCGVVI